MAVLWKHLRISLSARDSARHRDCKIAFMVDPRIDLVLFIGCIYNVYAQTVRIQDTASL